MQTLPQRTKGLGASDNHISESLYVCLKLPVVGQRGVA